MPIPLPKLDDRSYDDFIERARALIPGLYPEWTDHNPSDPGIVLAELFAWLMEMMMYRIDRVPEKNYEIFLKLLNGGQGVTTSTDDLNSQIRQSILALRARYRAATVEDYEKLTMEDWHVTMESRAMGAQGRVERVRCLKELNLEISDPLKRLQPAPGHVTLVVVPARDGSGSVEIKPTVDLLQALWRYFEQRRLLTTRHHVVGPDYVEVQVEATLYLKDDASSDIVRERATKHLAKFFHPLTGGPEGKGWPFGRDVHLSEIYACLDEVPGIDFVRYAKLNAPNMPQMTAAGEGLERIKLQDHELVALDSAGMTFTFMERLAGTWKKIS